MIINHVKAQQFKNYSDLSISLSSTCNVIYGLNGSGKTNFLDLIHFICLGKSYFSITDKQAINHDGTFFRLEAQLISQTKEDVKLALSVPRNGRKKIWYQGSVLKKNTDILGLIPVVCIVPDDIDLIKASSIRRRKFMDRIMCQLSSSYTSDLVNYERALKQKLAIYKNTSSYADLNHSLLDSYDQVLFSSGTQICSKRKEFCESFDPHFKSLYSDIAGGEEQSEIIYKSNFDQERFIQDSIENREIDFFTKRVRKGIHRDDLIFTINTQDVRKFGSQGQIKTFIYSLKLSEFLFLSENSKETPILLLDDIFEKLDVQRLEKLFQIMTSSVFGQIFITDTEKDRSIDILKNFNVNYSTFVVANNSIAPSHG